jgi:hypothetical protein
MFNGLLPPILEMESTEIRTATAARCSLYIHAGGLGAGYIHIAIREREIEERERGEKTLVAASESTLIYHTFHLPFIFFFFRE